MDNGNKTRLLAKIISRVFGPFQWFPILQVFVFYSLGLQLLSIRLFLSILVVWVFPVFYMLGGLVFGWVKDWDMTDRKERRGFFFLMSVFFGLAAIVNIGTDELVVMNLTFSITWLIVAVITLQWKISGHLAFDTLIILFLAHFEPIFLLGILVIPAVSWARIYLEKHTFNQVKAGFILALASFGVFLLI